MAQFSAVTKNPPWVHSNAQTQPVAQLGQPPPQLAATILTPSSTGPINTSSSFAVLQQAQQPTSQPQSFGLATFSLAQNPALQQVNMIQPGLGLAQQMSMPPPSSLPLGMALSTTAPIASISYPTPRLMQQVPPPSQPGVAAPNSQSNSSGKQQRVFTGAVTTLHKNFGFVDEDVFFQTSCIHGTKPFVGDRVLVEATFNANMPFKWNATRVQLIPGMGSGTSAPGSDTSGVRSLKPQPPPPGTLQSSIPMNQLGGRSVNPNSNKGMPASYNNVPPPSTIRNSSIPTLDTSFIKSGAPRPAVDYEQRDRQRDRDAARRERERERRARDQDKSKASSPPQKRSRSPRRKRSPSPPRKKSRPTPRYNVQVPKISLDLVDANVMELRKRYTSLYVPSDFFQSTVSWYDAFSLEQPFQLDKPCRFHIMHKDVDSLTVNDAVLEPADIDHTFSAKVMLLASPPLEELYRRSCRLAQDSMEVQDECIHPARIISFLVGLRGKNETMAIGGPWSPSLDGPNPDKDPKVLINTAIRTCKALTGIDLSNCTKWYRFLEVHYRRNRSTAGSSSGSGVNARIETVVLFFPDVWSCLPTHEEWAGQIQAYNLKLQQLLDASTSEEAEEMDEATEEDDKKTPTHYSELDPKQMKISDLRRELEARNMSPKGIKTQLIARLNKAIKTESEKDDEDDAGSLPEEKKSNEEDWEKQDEEKKNAPEVDKEVLTQQYTLPESSAVIVHPSRTARGGKFDCTVMSLSLLLDYRQEDNKEHSFEVSLFAELFNEMLMRDFGFRMYCSLMTAFKKEQENTKDDDKKDKKKSSEKSNGDSGEKDDDKEQKPEVPMRTHDPALLLSYAYFDQSHCGYVQDRDLEEIFYTLGLSLSRAQVKNIVQKVVTREKFQYRTLTDCPVDEPVLENVSEKKALIAQLASGNSGFLPVLKLEPVEPTIVPATTPTKGRGGKRGKSELKEGGPSVDMVIHRGALIDINKLLLQLDRSENDRTATDLKIKELQENLETLTKCCDRQENENEKLNRDLQETYKSLREVQASLDEAQNSRSYFKTSLEECQQIITRAVGNTTSSVVGVKLEGTVVHTDL